MIHVYKQSTFTESLPIHSPVSPASTFSYTMHGTFMFLISANGDAPGS